MRALLPALTFAWLGSPIAVGAFDLSTIVVPVQDTLQQQAVGAVEKVIRDKAGVLSLSLQQPITLGEIAAKECPGASQAYLDLLPQGVVRHNPELFAGSEVTLDTLIPVNPYVGTQLYIPYCLGAFNEKYVVKEGDGLWNVFEAQQGLPNAISDFDLFVVQANALNGAKVGADNMLTKGDTIAVPGATWRVPVATDLAGSVATDLRAVTGIDVQVLTDTQNWGAAEQADTEEDCLTVTESEAVLGAERSLWDISDALMYNDALDEAQGLRRAKAAVNVAVLDSGIIAPGHPTMHRLLKPLTDEDEEILAFPNDPKGYHGTGVLFTAAGGYLLSTLGFPVRAAALNVYVAPCRAVGDCQFVADPNKLIRGLKAAFERNTDVSAVNISISFKGSDPGVRDYVGDDKDVLIVTSAGNDGDEIDDSNGIFPALFGGTEGSNLITVASVDLDNDLSPLSNWSAAKIDLAAWGCNVPVAEFDPAANRFVRKLRTGTSYAAPQVVFAAAMLLREQPANVPAALTPSELKIRLVTSADHYFKLRQEVREGRVLNLAKALSIHADLVELAVGGNRLFLRGQLDFDGSDASIALCGNQSIRRGDLLSVNDLGPGTTGVPRYLIYRRTSTVGQGVETLRCGTLTADILLKDPFTGTVMPLDNSQIRSIVLATYPYWEN